MSDSDLQSRIAPVLGRIPSGVFILVAGDGTGRRTGLLTSWVQQASFEPPQVTIAVNKSRYLIDWLQDRFAGDAEPGSQRVTRCCFAISAKDLIRMRMHFREWTLSLRTMGWSRCLLHWRRWKEPFADNWMRATIGSCWSRSRMRSIIRICRSVNRLCMCERMDSAISVDRDSMQRESCANPDGVLDALLQAFTGGPL